MKYSSIAIIIIAVTLSSVSFILLSNSMSNARSEAINLTYVPSNFLHIDYTADVGRFLHGEAGFEDLLKDYPGLYWVKGRVVNIAVLDNASSAQVGEDCSRPYHGLSRLIFYFVVEDVIWGPEDLVGRTIRVYDYLVEYDDGKVLFVYDHLPLIPGKTYVLGLRETDELIKTVHCPDGENKILVLNHTTYVVTPLMRFLVTEDGHVIYLYDRDAIYEADPEYAQLMNKVTDPVVVTYTGNDPHLTGKLTYDEFRAWLLTELGQRGP